MWIFKIQGSWTIDWVTNLNSIPPKTPNFLVESNFRNMNNVRAVILGTARSCDNSSRVYKCSFTFLPSLACLLTKYHTCRSRPFSPRNVHVTTMSSLTMHHNSSYASQERYVHGMRTRYWIVLTKMVKTLQPFLPTTTTKGLHFFGCYFCKWGTHASCRVTIILLVLKSNNINTTSRWASKEYTNTITWGYRNNNLYP